MKLITFVVTFYSLSVLSQSNDSCVQIHETVLTNEVEAVSNCEFYIKGCNRNGYTGEASFSVIANEVKSIIIENTCDKKIIKQKEVTNKKLNILGPFKVNSCWNNPEASQKRVYHRTMDECETKRKMYLSL